MIIVAYYKIINKTKESVKLTKVGQRKVGELDPLAVFHICLPVMQLCQLLLLHRPQTVVKTYIIHYKRFGFFAAALHPNSQHHQINTDFMCQTLDSDVLQQYKGFYCVRGTKHKELTMCLLLSNCHVSIRSQTIIRLMFCGAGDEIHLSHLTLSVCMNSKSSCCKKII